MTQDKPKYCFPMVDGYDIAEIIIIGNRSYEILEIDAANQLMILQEVKK